MKYIYSILSLSTALILIYPIEISAEELSVEKQYLEIIKNLDGPADYKWPPVVEIVTTSDIIASSSIYYDEKNNNYGYKIKLSTGLLDSIVSGDKNLLNFILCHELSHILLGHLNKKGKDISLNLINQIKKSEEYETDIKAVAIASDAGCKYNDLVKSIRKIKELGSHNSSFNCLTSEHPAWSDRLANIDVNQRDIWQALSSFGNGATLLSLGYYKPAIYCFKNVLELFPECYEAYSNIGYAKLMSYIELLEAEDIEKLKIGQIISGAFYNDAFSVREKVRGMDLDLWWDAVAELRMAIKLNEKLTLAHSNLGLAYLVSPIRSADLGRSSKHFNDALTYIEQDSTLTESEKAAVYINAGVSYIYAGLKESDIEPLFAKANENERRFAEFNNNYSMTSGSEINSAIIYNKAMIRMGNSDLQSQLKAKALLDEYIISANKSDVWYQSALNKRNEICNRLDLANCSDTLLLKDRTNNKIIGLNLNDTTFIMLSARTHDLLNELKGISFKEKRLIPGRDLKQIRFKEYGIDLLASDYIFAIILNSIQSPKVNLNHGKDKIYVGLSSAELPKIIGDSPYQEGIYTFSKKKRYRYYNELGIALFINPITKIIDEIIISQLE